MDQVKKSRLRAAIAFLLLPLPTLTNAAEFSCAPSSSPARFDVDSDPSFLAQAESWRAITKNRPTEGGQKNCSDFAIPGYEGFPTKRCSYSDADAGVGHFPALPAQVIVLNPSSAQLARWTIRACQLNGAKGGTRLERCLAKLREHIKRNNGSQFPVAGSVIESRCNSGGPLPCKDLPRTHPDRAPRNTLFRDGLNIYYTTIAKWSRQTLADQTYAALFDIAKADADIYSWRNNARIAGTTREAWTAWRTHLGKSVQPDGVAAEGFDLKGPGWGLVTREVHKRACASDENELVNAVVHFSGLAK